MMPFGNFSTAVTTASSKAIHFYMCSIYESQKVVNVLGVLGTCCTQERLSGCGKQFRRREQKREAAEVCSGPHQHSQAGGLQSSAPPARNKMAGSEWCWSGLAHLPAQATGLPIAVPITHQNARAVLIVLPFLCLREQFQKSRCSCERHAC